MFWEATMIRLPTVSAPRIGLLRQPSLGDRPRLRTRAAQKSFRGGFLGGGDPNASPQPTLQEVLQVRHTSVPVECLGTAAAVCAQ
jgi:hypothetical protein